MYQSYTFKSIFALNGNSLASTNGTINDYCVVVV